MSNTKALESGSIVDLVKESELKQRSDNKRAHNYNMDDQVAKAKILKNVDFLNSSF